MFIKNDLSQFLTVSFCRELADFNDIDSGVSYYTDEEIRQAIVQDVLAFMDVAKIQNAVVFKFDQLTQFVNEANLERVKLQLQHPDVVAFVHESNYGYWIEDNRDLRQAAMDFCGVWYDGYKMPPDAIVVSREALNEAVDHYGGIDQLATGMGMELSSTGPLVKNIQ